MVRTIRKGGIREGSLLDRSLKNLSGFRIKSFMFIFSPLFNWIKIIKIIFNIIFSSILRESNNVSSNRYKPYFHQNDNNYYPGSYQDCN